MSMDVVFKALSDPVRRKLLDRLREENGQTLSHLGQGMGMTRQAVSKHLALLEAANLVAFERRGRERLHYLNPIPIQQLSDRWIGKYQRAPARALVDLKQKLEGETDMKDRFLYVIYIQSTPAKVWHALTDPDMNRQFWFGMHQESDWKVGSGWKIVDDEGKAFDEGKITVLEPQKKMQMTWLHLTRPELTAEGEALCTIELEEMKGMVKLTVTHEIDVADSQLLKAVSNGWPMILSAMKSLLEQPAAA